MATVHSQAGYEWWEAEGRIDRLRHLWDETDNPNDCRWPMGNPGSPYFHFCCQDIVKGSAWPYCAKHKKEAKLKAIPAAP
jgi:hypothetical protein